MSERGDGLMTVAEVALALGVKRRTVYNIPFLWERVIYVRPRAPRFEPADVETYKRIHKQRAA